MNLLTAFVLIFIIIFMAVGAHKGFVRSALTVVMSIVSVLLAYLVVPMVASFLINNTKLDEDIEARIKTKIYAEAKEHIEDKIKAQYDTGFFDTYPALLDELTADAFMTEPNKNQQIEIINNIGVPDTLKTSLIENLGNVDLKSDLGVTGFYDYISKYVAYRIVNLIAYILTFAFFSIVFTIIMVLLRVAVKLPVLNGLNHVGGALVSGIEAILVIWLLMAVLDNLPDNEWRLSLANQINESGFLSLLHDKNIFLSMINTLKK